MKMNPLIFTLLLITMTGFVPLSHAETGGDTTTAQDVKQQTQDLIETLKGYGTAQRDEAIQKTREALARLDRRIDDLEMRIDDNWDQMDKAAREKARASLRALRRQRIRVAEWYGGWKDSSAGAWEHMKEGFSNAYQALHDAWEKAEKEYSGGK